MAEVQSGGKICTVCGQDCSSKPRAKDAEGRYTCKDCLDRAKEARAAREQSKVAGVAAAKAAPAAAGPDDNTFILDLAGPKIEPGKSPCAGCGKAMKDELIVCVNCGYNKQTGKKLDVKVVKPKELKQSSMSPALAENAPLIVTLVLAGALGGCAYWGQEDTTGIICYVALAGVLSLVSAILLLVDAFRESVGAGLLCLFLPFYAVYFAFVRSENAWVKYLYSLNLIAWIATNFIFDLSKLK